MPRNPNDFIHCIPCNRDIPSHQYDSHVTGPIHRQAYADQQAGAKEAFARVVEHFDAQPKTLEQEVRDMAEGLRSGVVSHTDAANWIMETAERLSAARSKA